MDALDISNLLAGRAEEVCAFLFPNGRRKGNEWCVGGIGGEAGDSLKIVLSGGKAGYWQDFANSSTMRGRGILTLWRDAKCPGDMAAAVNQAKSWLGVRDDLSRHVRTNAPNWSVPDKTTAHNLKPKSPVMEYLVNVRGLREDVLKTFKVAESKDGLGYVFPYFTDDKLCLLKTVLLERKEGKKQSFVSPNGLAVLFGKGAVNPSSEYVVITEGEIDAITWYAAGHPAVSIPMGVNNDKWIEYDYKWLERFERIYLSFDNDQPGQDAMKRIVERLGRERCYAVKLPLKDANEVWLDGTTEFQQFLDDAKRLDPEEIKMFFSDSEGLWKRLNDDSEVTMGTPTPWALPIRIRRGENTIVTGYSFHGKSQALLHLATHLIENNWRGMIASFEVNTEVAEEQLLQIASGKLKVDRQEFDRLTSSPLAETIFYDHKGKVSWKKLLEIYRFCVKAYGVSFAIFDSLLMCGVSGDDYEQQDEFMRQIQITAKETNTHIFVVCHARKRESSSEAEPPSKQDVKGSGGITDLCFNLLSVWRDTKTTTTLTSPNAPFDRVSFTPKPNSKIVIFKQKYGRGTERGAVGSVDLYFDQASGQYRSGPYDIPKRYFVRPPIPSDNT